MASYNVSSRPLLDALRVCCANDNSYDRFWRTTATQFMMNLYRVMWVGAL